MPKKVYVISSLKHPDVPVIARALRAAGHTVFDDWWCAGPKADHYWQEYEQSRGHTYAEGLVGPAAEHNFKLDEQWLMWADTAVLVLPAGKDAHLEAGFVKGRGGELHIIMPDDPEKWGLMLRFADSIHRDVASLVEYLAEPEPESEWFSEGGR